MNEFTFETKLYTTIWEFTSPFSYEETLKKIKEWNWILTLKRFSIWNKTIENNWELSQIAVNTEITVMLNTNICQILCYEEFKMKDIKKSETEIIVE